MIVRKDNGDRRGVLIDWDHCIILQDIQHPPQTGRAVSDLSRPLRV